MRPRLIPVTTITAATTTDPGPVRVERPPESLLQLYSPLTLPREFAARRAGVPLFVALCLLMCCQIRLKVEGLETFPVEPGNNGWAYYNEVPVPGPNGDEMHATCIASHPSDSSVVISGYTDAALIGSNAGSFDIFAIRLDFSGSEVWRYQSGTPSSDYAFGVAIDQSDDSIVIAGYTSGAVVGSNVGGSDIFAIKLNSSGSELWRYQAGTSDADNARDVAIDQADSSIVIVGYTSGAVVGSNAGGTDIFAIKLNSSGSELWRYQVGESGGDYAYGVAIDQSDSSVVLTGETHNALIGTYSGSGDAFAIKLDSDGSEVWRYQSGTVLNSLERMEGVAIDQSDSSIVIAGRTDPSFQGFFDIYAIKLDSSGAEVWRYHVVTSNFFEAWAHGVAVDQSDSSIMLVGHTGSDSTLIGPNARRNKQIYAIFAIKLDSSGSELWRFETQAARSTSTCYANGVTINPSDSSVILVGALANREAIFAMKLSNVTIIDTLTIKSTVSEPSFGERVADVLVNHTFFSAYGSYVQVCIMAIPNIADSYEQLMPQEITGTTYPAVHQCAEYFVNTTNSTSYLSVVRIALPASWANSIFNVYAASVFNGAPPNIRRFPSSFRTPSLSTNSFLPVVDSPDWNYVVADGTPNSAHIESRGIACCHADSTIVIAGMTQVALAVPIVGGLDIFAIKLDASGSEVWRYQTGTSSEDLTFGVAIDQSDCSAVLSGNTDGSLIGANAGGHDIFAIKLDSTGTELWRYQTGTSEGDYSTSIAIDQSDSSVVLAGATQGSLTGSNPGGIDAFAIKIDSAGVEQWRYQTGTSGDDSATGIAVDESDSSIVLTGSFTIRLTSYGSEVWRYQAAGGGIQSGLGIDQSDSSIVLAGSTSVVKIDSAGTVLQVWQHQNGTPVEGLDQATVTVTDVAIDQTDSSIFVVGYIEGYFASDSLLVNIYAVKLESSGSILWSFIPNYPMTLYVYSVAVDLSGNAFLTGIALAAVGGHNQLFAAPVLKVAKNYLDPNSSIVDVSLIDVSYCNATVSVSVGLYLSYVSRVTSSYTMCALAVPALDSRSSSIMNASAIDIIRDYDTLQLPLYSARTCISGLSELGDIITNIHLDGLLVNTAYSVVAVHSLLNLTQVEHSLFRTRKAEAIFASSLQVSTPVISLAQPRLALSLSATMFGNPPNLYVSAETFGFNLSTSESAPDVIIPKNQDGSPRTSMLRLPDMALIRDPLRTLPLGNHDVVVSINIAGSGTADTVLNIESQKNFTVALQIRGTLLVSQPNDASLNNTLMVLSESNNDIEIEIYPAPAASVTVSFSTIGGAPPLHFFVNSSDSLLPSAISYHDRSTSVIRQTWQLTDNAYAASLILQPSVTGPNAALVTYVPAQVHLHIRSAVQCRAVRVVGNSPLSPMKLYAGQSSADVPEVQISCTSTLRFVTSDTRVFVGLSTSSEISTSSSRLEISQSSETVVFDVNAVSVGIHTIAFTVTTASSQLNPSFFPVNPDGYQLQVHVMPAATIILSTPTACNISAFDIAGIDIPLNLSAPAEYTFTLTPVSSDDALVFAPSSLTFFPDGPLLATLTISVAQSARTGPHSISYSISGSGSAAIQHISDTTVNVFGSIRIDPEPDTLYTSLVPLSRSVILSGLPPVAEPPLQLNVHFESQRTEAGGYIDVQPSQITFTSSSSELMIPLSTFVFAGTPEDGSIELSARVIGNASHLYQSRTWTVGLQTQRTIFMSPSINIGSNNPPSWEYNRHVQSGLTLPASSTTRVSPVSIMVALVSWNNVGVYYGHVHRPASEWNSCGETRSNNGTYYQSLQVYRVTCFVSANVGANYSIGIARVSSSNVPQTVLATTQAMFSFPAPVISAGSLRLAEFGIGDTQVFGSAVSASDIVYFEGLHFGSDKSVVSVTFGPVANSGRFTCNVLSVNDTIIRCQMVSGQGINLVFKVNVGGQYFAGTDTYSYPNSPSITRIQGCDSGQQASASAVQECPTLGTVILTMYGTFFAASSKAMQVFVGGQDCDIQSVVLGSTEQMEDMLTCTLPPGSGDRRDVQLSRAFGDVTLTSTIIPSTPRISYAKPVITSISSPNCTSVSSTELTNCPRHRISAEGPGPGLGVRTLEDDTVLNSQQPATLPLPTVPLTIFGNHFGNSSIVVIIGSTACLNPSITVLNILADSQRIDCGLPLSQDTDQPVLVLVPNGATNQDSPASISFKQCP
jgi:IPT/TIG domain